MTDVIGPFADNATGLGAGPYLVADSPNDATYGYGSSIGLAVFNGQLYPVWAGNLRDQVSAVALATPITGRW